MQGVKLPVAVLRACCSAGLHAWLLRALLWQPE